MRIKFLFLVLLFSCGAEKKEDVLHPKDENLCLSCSIPVSDPGYTIPESDDVFVRPTELLFICVNDAGICRDTLNVEIINNTNFPVQLKSVGLTVNPDWPSNSNSFQFTCDWPKTIEPESSLQIFANFDSATSSLSSALLEINTSAGVFTVTLYGWMLYF